MSMEEEEFGSDTDDDDYTPDDGPAASEEENSGDEEAPPAAEGAVVETKKVRKKKAVMATGRGGMFEEGGDRIDWGAEQEKERKEVSEEVEKKKSEDIWADFKKDTGGSTARTKPAGSGLGSLASLAAPSPAQAPQAKPKSRFGSIFDSVEKEKKPEVDKVEEAVKEKPKSRFSSLFDTNSSSSKAEGEEPPKAATAPGDKVEITKEFDFAGEVVKVSKQVAADSREAAKFLAAGTTTSTTKRPGGLAGVVGSIGKVRRWSYYLVPF